MKILNTLTRRKEEFVPINEGKVGIYVCGPTVYDYIHIGNARPMIVFDTLRRYLEYKGYDVNYVSNFTDVDDKIIKRANEEGVDASVISERYIAEVKKDIDDLRSGNRDLLVSGVDEKEDPLDFVLWKPKKEGEPSWPSPWGDGRPGWHLECSVMSKKYIGDVIDIHAGGEDLVFPHHENEIAQSEAANGTEFARYWMHNGFLKINNEKMSKSLGNFFTVREIAEKYPLQVIRFFMLSAHYRSPLNFSADLVEASKNGLERILTAVDRLKSISGTEGEVDKAVADEMDAFVKKYEAAMDDDLNTADAISVIFELVKYANVNVTEESTKATVELVLNTVTKLCDILGIITEKKKEILDSDIEALIEERQAARKAKNFARADEIRDQLSDMGIILEDTREGVKWKRA